MIRASVAGASGYAGGELLRLLLAHPQIEVAAVAAGGKAGQAVGSVHPNLVDLSDRVLVETTPDALAEADITFLALPHGQSAALVCRAPARPQGRRPRRRLPAARRCEVGRLLRRHAARGDLGLRPAGAPRGAGGHQRSCPGGESGVLRDVGRPRPRTAGRRRADRDGRHRRRGSLGHLRCRPLTVRRAAGVAGHGLDVGVQGGGSAPAHAGDGAVGRRGLRSRRAAVVHAAARAHAAGDREHLHGHRRRRHDCADAARRPRGGLPHRGLRPRPADRLLAADLLRRRDQRRAPAGRPRRAHAVVPSW